MSDNSPVTLVIADQRGEESKVELTTLGTYLIGCAADCQITLTSRDNTVSQRHAQLIVEKDAVYVEDLESRTGTTVNGRIVSHAKLENEDTITISRYNLDIILPHTEETVEQLYVDASLRSN
jgi:pSer/pThr/pTyr-binding forkhead associated (FHA) protein